MSLVYFAADMLGMTLYQIDGKLSSSEVRQLKWGPWNVDLQVDAESDIINGKEMTFWVTMAKRLRLYTVVREKECWMFVLDSNQMKKFDKKGYVGTSLKERLLEFRPAVRAFFRWHKDRWSEVPLDEAPV